MADTKLAKIGLTPKEPWAADISYEVLDVTLYSTGNGGDGCSYVAMRDNIGVTPGTDDSAWLKLSQAGQSIYDLAVKYHHFDGTEEEFEAEYQAVLQAARDAATATNATNTAVQNAETLRVAAEQGRVSAESARADAEALRASAELTRENNETARGNAESVRVSAESGRVTAENGRVSAEQGRVSAESARASAETERRSTFESLKTDMQTAIGQADAATAAAVALNEEVAGDEADRVTAETARETAESGRVSAESARVTAESGRVTAESGRVSAESARVSAETARVAQASSDHTRAESDHGTAATDHTTAGADHTQAGADHTASEAATTAANTAAAAADAARESIQDDLAALGHEVSPLFVDSVPVLAPGLSSNSIAVTNTGYIHLIINPLETPTGNGTILKGGSFVEIQSGKLYIKIGSTYNRPGLQIVQGELLDIKIEWNAGVYSFSVNGVSYASGASYSGSVSGTMTFANDEASFPLLRAEVIYANISGAFFDFDNSVFSFNPGLSTKLSVQLSFAVADTIKGWIIGESFLVSSVTRDGNGNVTAANVVWPDTKTGTLTITRDADGNTTQMVATHDGTTYTLAITRDSDGNVTATSIS